MRLANGDGSFRYFFEKFFCEKGSRKTVVFIGKVLI